MAKRLFDVLVSACLLAALSPLFVVIVLGIRLSSRGPIFFRQQRAGKDGVPFDLLKFRSMHTTPVTTTETFKGDPRVFRFGKVIREYHLDELPQLVNVLRGEMSIVGPRPTLPEQVARYSERERGRLSVPPGITGLAQISGNNELDWDERIEVDLDYVSRASLRLDISILMRTLKTVVKKEGVYGLYGHVRDKR